MRQRKMTKAPDLMTNDQIDESMELHKWMARRDRSFEHRCAKQLLRALGSKDIEADLRKKSKENRGEDYLTFDDVFESVYTLPYRLHVVYIYDINKVTTKQLLNNFAKTAIMTQFHETKADVLEGSENQPDGIVFKWDNGPGDSVLLASYVDTQWPALVWCDPKAEPSVHYSLLTWSSFLRMIEKTRNPL